MPWKAPLSALAADRPAERVTKCASRIFRPHQSGRRDLRAGWREDFSHLFDRQGGGGIGDARSVVEELAVESFNCQTAHESSSPVWIWVVHGM